MREKKGKEEKQNKKGYTGKKKKQNRTTGI